jgi:autotransporter translocation and assembly factor TamB
VAGSLDAYRYDGSGTVEAIGRSARFMVEGNAARLALEAAQLVLTPPAPQDGGTLAATGNVHLQERTANLALTATNLDPAWLVAAWPGRLTGTAALRASLDPEPNGTLEGVALTGTLRGYPVAVGGAVALTGRDAVRLDGLRLDSETNYVVLNGALDGTVLDLAVEAELAELDLLVPDVGGALSAELAIDGTWQQPRGRGSVGLRNLSFAGTAVEQLDLRGEAG